MGFKFNTLLRAILAGSPYIAPPPSGPVTYGAPADSGQINETDTLLGSGNRYWVNSSTGSNSNTGLVQASPIQYLDKVCDYTSNNGTLPYNVTAPSKSHFLLARGTTYDGFLLANTIPTSAPYTAYGDFRFGASGTGVRPKILFKHSPDLYNAVNSALATSHPGTQIENIDLDMQFSLKAAVTGISGTFVDGDVVTATGGTASGAVGIFHYNQSGSFSIQVTSFPTSFLAGDVITATGGKQATISSVAYCGGIETKQADQSVKNGSIVNALGNGILMTSIDLAVDTYSDNLVIQGMTIGNCCRKQTTGAGIDGGGGIGRPVNNITITQNTVYDCGQPGSTLSHNIYLNDTDGATISYNWVYMTANFGNFGLIMHGVCANDVIHHNLFEWCSNGIGVNDGYSRIESFTNITIRNNINRQHGNRSGQTQGNAMYLYSLVDCNIYNNLHYENKSGYILGANFGSGGGDSLSSGNTFSHETLYNMGGPLQMQGVMGATANIIQNCIIMSTAASGYLLNVDANAYPKTTVRNLLLYAPNNSGNCIAWNGTNYTLDNWMTAVGTGLGCIKADPLFTDAAAGDFTLQAGSPCKLAGYNSGIATDFADNARHATTPSIGAYE